MSAWLIAIRAGISPRWRLLVLGTSLISIASDRFDGCHGFVKQPIAEPTLAEIVA
jgi:hypothetical protein